MFQVKRKLQFAIRTVQNVALNSEIRILEQHEMFGINYNAPKDSFNFLEKDFFLIRFALKKGFTFR